MHVRKSPTHLRSEPAAAQRRMQFTLGESNAKSIWSTSVYSYTGKGGGPGGGLADEKLRVGGWGDQYVALIQFDLPSRQTVHQALLKLAVMGDSPKNSRPTPMRLEIITQPWVWRAGDRLWWRDLPPGTPLMGMPTPGPPGSIYEINITEIYNDWANGRRPNFGLMLFPVLNDNNYSTFYSTRANPSQRPSLELTY